MPFPCNYRNLTFYSVCCVQTVFYPLRVCVDWDSSVQLVRLEGAVVVINDVLYAYPDGDLRDVQMMD